MAFDGNGNWVSNYYPVAGTKIEAGTFNDTFIADLEASFENCLTRDGQGKTTTDFNVNNNRVINVSNPSQPKDAVNKQTMESNISSKVPASIGSGTKPVYTNASGVITASSSSVGSTTKPIYMTGGTLTPSNATVGSSTQPVYMNGGTITASNSTVGGTAKPVYMNGGTVTQCSSTVGGTAKPVYMNGGTITQCSSTVGSTTQPVYMNGGTITACGFSKDDIMTAPNYGAMYAISSGFNPPSNGWIYIRHLEWVGTTITIEGKEVYNHSWLGGDFGTQYQSSYLPVKKGKPITITFAVTGRGETVKFIPCS